MKNPFFISIIFFLQSILVSNITLGHQPNCYITYKRIGDSSLRVGNYDLAIQLYQNAKYCRNLSEEQRKELDRLILEAYRRKQPRK